MNISDEKCIAAYEANKNLKIAADNIGMKWQTLYWRLKKCGVKVVGDKSKYGSMSDKVGAKGEAEFLRIVPYADNQNLNEYQSKIDFMVKEMKVEIKSSHPRKTQARFDSKTWAFAVRRQESIADFFVCFGFNEDQKTIGGIFLIPSEISRHLQTISISVNGVSKWKDYLITEPDLKEFFDSLI